MDGHPQELLAAKRGRFDLVVADSLPATAQWPKFPGPPTRLTAYNLWETAKGVMAFTQAGPKPNRPRPPPRHPRPSTFNRYPNAEVTFYADRP